MTKNAYLARQREAMMQCVLKGADFGNQQSCDVMCIALHRMGWGKERLLRLRTEMTGVVKEFRLAWGNEPETDYIRHKLDEELRAIFGDDVVEFKDRYPYQKDWDYSKGGK